MKLKQRLKKLPRPPIYGDKTVRLAFEFGLILSETAKERNIELTGEITTRAEDILIKELKKNGLAKTALNFVPLLLATLETK